MPNVKWDIEAKTRVKQMDGLSFVQSQMDDGAIISISVH